MATYWVVGGEYESTAFERLRPGTEALRLGPYDDYQAAYRKWQELAWQSVDNCNIRYRIVSGAEAAA